MTRFGIEESMYLQHVLKNNCRTSMNGLWVEQAENRLDKLFSQYRSVLMCNGTVPIQVALKALGVGPGDFVITTPLTMSATTIAIELVGAIPVWCDVGPETWTLDYHEVGRRIKQINRASLSGKVKAIIAVSLYGEPIDIRLSTLGVPLIHDAAQSFPLYDSFSDFITLSFQASKILTTGEGGALLCKNKDHAMFAKQFRSLGYFHTKIDKKDPKALRHEHITPNYRMSDFQAAVLLGQLDKVNILVQQRRDVGGEFMSIARELGYETQAYKIEHNFWGAGFLHPNPKKLIQDYNLFGGEGGYAAWGLTYKEPAWNVPVDTCPVAEELQTRIVAMSTNIEFPVTSYQALRKALERIH